MVRLSFHGIEIDQWLWSRLKIIWNELLSSAQMYFQSGPHKTMSNGLGQTLLTLEWTNQHGCGGNEDTDPHKLNCNIVLQYMCQDETVTGERSNLLSDSKWSNFIRNGFRERLDSFKLRFPAFINHGFIKCKKNALYIRIFLLSRMKFCKFHCIFFHQLRWKLGSRRIVRAIKVRNLDCLTEMRF